jgi:hypothetical protein
MLRAELSDLHKETLEQCLSHSHPSPPWISLGSVDALM